jgi:hypothetical protein
MAPLSVFLAHCPNLEPMCSCGPACQIGRLNASRLYAAVLLNALRKRVTSSSLVPPLSSPDENINFLVSGALPSI